MKGQSLLTNVVMATLMELPDKDRDRLLAILMPELPAEEQEQLGAAMREARLALINVPRVYQHCSFDNFLTYNDHTTLALARARRVAAEFPVGRRGLILEGPSGVGKTHLAVAALKECVRPTGARGLFVNVPQFVHAYGESRDKRALMEPLIEAEVLVFDDLGNEAWVTPFEPVDNVVSLLIDARYENLRLTIFTTNYPDLVDGSDERSLLFRVGVHTHSRLREMCEPVTIIGADYRELPANGNADDLRTLWKVRGAPLTKGSAAHPARSTRTLQEVEALLRTTIAERDEARGQLQKIGRKAFWAAKAPDETK